MEVAAENAVAESDYTIINHADVLPEIAVSRQWSLVVQPEIAPRISATTALSTANQKLRSPK